MSALRVSPEAETDLDEIWFYIARDNPTAATRFLGRIRRRFDTLCGQPLIGETCENLGKNLRQFTVERKYVIFYRYDESSDMVDVVRVVHGARDVLAIFGRREGE